MRILLIQPGSSPVRFARPFGAVEPLGLESIAAALETLADVEFIDMRFASTEELTRRIADDGIRACGITSTFTMDYKPVVRLAETIKKVNPGMFVFVGGHHPSLRPIDFFLPSIDAVVVGEGERTVVDLCRSVEAGGNLERVEGIAFNSRSCQSLTPPRGLIRNLDSLASPKRSLVDRFRKQYRLFTEHDVTSIETSRGCPFRCNFCSVWVFYGGKVRMKSPEVVVGEIVDAATDEVFFVDDNFFSSAGRASRIASLLKDAGVRKRYLLQTRTDVVAKNPGLIETWAEIGLRGVFLGVEKVTQNGLDAVEKRNTVENNETALRILESLDVAAVTSFITDTEADGDDFAALRDFVKRMKLRMPLFTILTPLPGTNLFEQKAAEMTSLDYDKFDLFHPVMNTKLQPSRFLEEFSRLYRTAYPTRVAIFGGLGLLLQVFAGKLSLRDWLEIVGDWRKLTTPEAYV